MKKIMSLLLLFATLSCGLAKADNLHIECTSEQLGDSALIFTAANYRTPTVVAVKDHKISYDYPLDNVTMVYVMGKSAAGGGQPLRVSFLGVPGEKAVVTTEGTHFYVSGSKFYQDFNTLDRATENMQEPAKVADYLLGYIKSNPASEAPVALLLNLDYENMQKVYDALGASVKGGRMKSFTDMLLAQAKQQDEADKAAAKKQASGLQAPDFTLNDINGKSLALSSLRGKYVILDFWGSWCGWCIKGMPQMKEYYKKYAGKFEIVGVDCNDSQEKWKEAVKKYELPWLHVYNPRDSKVLDDYGIQGFPTKILIGPDGKIVKTVVGEDPAFYTLLDQTFGNK